MLCLNDEILLRCPYILWLPYSTSMKITSQRWSALAIDRHMGQLIGTIGLQTANKCISTFRPTCFDLVFCQNNHWIFCWFASL